MTDKCLVTLVFGDEYVRDWKAHAEPTWRAYAARHGYDLVVLDGPVRPDLLSADRPIHWQKCFVLQDERVRHYRHAVWVDADILINAEQAPCIVAGHDSAAIHAADIRPYFHGHLGHCVNERNWTFTLAHSIRAGQTVLGPLPPGQIPRIASRPPKRPDYNTGVLVMRPGDHAAALEACFHAHAGPGDRQGDYEQSALSVFLSERKLIAPLDPAFNAIAKYLVLLHYPFLFDPAIGVAGDLARRCFNTLFRNNYFLHFAGDGWQDAMALVDTTTPAEASLVGSLYEVFQNPPAATRHPKVDLHPLTFPELAALTGGHGPDDVS